MTSPRANPVFCAIDTPSRDIALDLACQVAPHVGGLKLGLEFFNPNGPDGTGRWLSCIRLGLGITRRGRGLTPCPYETTLRNHITNRAANVDDHDSGRLIDRKTNTDGRGHRFLNQIDFACTGPQC